MARNGGDAGFGWSCVMRPVGDGRWICETNEYATLKRAREEAAKIPGAVAVTVRERARRFQGSRTGIVGSTTYEARTPAAPKPAAAPAEAPAPEAGRKPRPRLVEVNGFMRWVAE